MSILLGLSTRQNSYACISIDENIDYPAMSMNMESAVLSGTDARIVKGLAANAGVDLPTYMQEVLSIGACCGEIVAANRAAGIETSLYLEHDDGSFVMEPLDFEPAQYTPPAEVVVMEEVDPLVLDSEEPIKLEFPDDVTEFFAGLLPKIGATVGSFFETAIDLRWKLSVMQARGGKMLVDDGPHEVTEIGFSED